MRNAVRPSTSSPPDGRVTGYITEITPEVHVERETHEVTSFGSESQQFVPGLTRSTITIRCTSNEKALEGLVKALMENREIAIGWA